jgi:hypothetical protein
VKRLRIQILSFPKELKKAKYIKYCALKNKWSLTRIKIISQLLFSTLRCPWTPWIPTPKWHNWQHLFWVHGISLSSFLPSIYLFILTLINCISVLWLLWLVFSAPMAVYAGLDLEPTGPCWPTFQGKTHVFNGLIFIFAHAVSTLADYIFYRKRVT